MFFMLNYLEDLRLSFENHTFKGVAKVWWGEVMSAREPKVALMTWVEFMATSM